MRIEYVVTSAATCIVLSLAYGLGWKAAGVGNGPSYESQASELVSETQVNRDAISALEVALLDLRARFGKASSSAKGAPLGVGPIEFGDLLARMEALEDAVEEMSSLSSSSSVIGEHSDNALLNNTLNLSGEEPARSPYSAAEDLFQRDSGIPLDNYSESIGEALHIAGGLSVSGMECRNTICKITYSKPRSLAPQDAFEEGFELVDRLSQATGGGEVDIRYATDPLGNDVMYIQLR